MHRDLITNSSLGIHRGRDWWIFKLLHRVAPLLAMEKVLVRNEATYGKMVINVAIEDGGRMDNCEIMGIIMAYIYITRKMIWVCLKMGVWAPTKLVLICFHGKDNGKPCNLGPLDFQTYPHIPWTFIIQNIRNGTSNVHDIHLCMYIYKYGVSKNGGYPQMDGLEWKIPSING